MPTVEEYLNELDKQRDNLAENLTTMGVEASVNEKYNTLVPKVLSIRSFGKSASIFSVSVFSNIVQNDGAT